MAVIAVTRGCLSPGHEVDWKNFLIQYPEYKLYINGTLVSKYDKILELSFLSSTVFGISKNEKLFEVAIKPNSGVIFATPLFKHITQISIERDVAVYFSIATEEEFKNYNLQRNTMMTIEQVLLVILISLIVAKFAAKITWKLIFTPLKRSTAHLKKEWEDS